MGKYTKAMYEQFRKEQDDKAAKAEQERREHVEKESARQAWIRDGGAEADFQREWSRLRDEGRRQRVLAADKHAREQMRSSAVSAI